MLQLRPLLLSLYFWLVPLIVLAATWDSIPQAATQLGLVAVLVIVGLSASLKQINYPLIGTPFFILLLANYWLFQQDISSPWIVPITAFTLILIPLTGLFARQLGRLPINREVTVHWLMLGFLTAQVNSLLIFWPFSFFENTLISFIAYYALWQLIQLFGTKSRRSVVAHFVFTLVAVIVVLGVLLWVNYPQLRIF